MRAKDIFSKDGQLRLIADLSVNELVALYGITWEVFEKDLGGSVYRLIKAVNLKTVGEETPDGTREANGDENG